MLRIALTYTGKQFARWGIGAMEEGEAMRVTKISVHGLKNQDAEYHLGPVSIFTGPNGSGKTSILQAVRFAVLGHDPSLGKAAEKIAPLMAADEMAVRLTAEKDGGAKLSVTRTLTNKGGKLSHGVRVLPSDGEEKLAHLQARVAQELGGFVPVFDLGELLGLSPDKRRAFLFALASEAGTLKAADLRAMACDRIPQGCSDEVQAAAVALVDKFLGLASRDGAETAHDVIERVVAALKAEESALNAERKHKHASLQGLTDELAGLPAVAGSLDTVLQDVEALNAQIGAATTELEGSRARLAEYRRAVARKQEIERARRTAAEDVSGRLAEIQASLAEQRERLTAQISGAEQCKLAVDEMDGLLLTARDREASAKSALAAAQAEREGGERLLKALGTCEMEGDPRCCLTQRRVRLAGKAQDIEAMTAEIQAAVGDRRQMVENREGALKALKTAEAEVERWRAQTDALGRDVGGLEKTLAARAASLQRLGEEEAGLAPVLEAAPVIDLEVLEQHLKGVQATRAQKQSAIVAITRREAIEKALQGARAALAQADVSAESLKAVKVAVGPKGLQGEAARVTIEPLIQAANQVLGQLPAGKALGVRTLSERGDEVLDIGWERDGKLIPFETLSGGERIQFAAALAVGLHDLKPLPLRVLLVDDLQSVDAANRVPFVRALAAMVEHGKLDNVVLASVEPVDTDGLEGVTHHKLG